MDVNALCSLGYMVGVKRHYTRVCGGMGSWTIHYTSHNDSYPFIRFNDVVFHLGGNSRDVPLWFREKYPVYRLTASSLEVRREIPTPDDLREVESDLCRARVEAVASYLKGGVVPPEWLAVFIARLEG